MKNGLYAAVLMCGLGVAGSAIANDKVDTFYDAKQFERVCKGKAQGDMVSFAYKGIIWNGSCQPQFIPTQSKNIKGDETQLNSICRSDPTTTSINIEGQQYKGKCTLAFTPPEPPRP